MADTILSRPPHPGYEPADGYEWRVLPDERWRLATAAEAASHKCRNSTRRRCPNAPVAAFNRGRVRSYGSRDGRRPMDLTEIDSWWFYCADHMYGRWIENGIVVCWWARPSELDDGERL